MTLDLSKVPETAILGVLVVFMVLVLFVPIALRLAGLTGQQIADLLKLTMQFFLNLLSEFRAQNKSDR